MAGNLFTISYLMARRYCLDRVNSFIHVFDYIQVFMAIFGVKMINNRCIFDLVPFMDDWFIN